MTNAERRGQETSIVPVEFIDLVKLQASYPLYYDSQIFDSYQILANKAFKSMTGIRDTALSIYGTDDKTSARYGMRHFNRETMANTMFINDLSESIANADNISEFEWRMLTFTAQASKSLGYVGTQLGLKKDVRPVLFNNRISERIFGPQNAKLMTAVQYIRFCDQHPDLKDKAFDIWKHAIRLIDPETSSLKDQPFVEGYQIENVMSYLEANGFVFNNPEVIKDINEKLLYKFRWAKNKAPIELATLSIRKLMTDLELVPIDYIEQDNLQKLQTMLEDTEPDLIDKPATLMIASTKAMLNYINSLSLHRGGKQTVTKHLLNQFAQFDGNNPLGFNDVMTVANILIPMFRQHYPDIAEADPTKLADFPKAIDRIMLVSVKEAEKLVTDQAIFQKYGVAADCIKLLGLYGVRAKLGQNVLNVADFVIRYSHLPLNTQRYYIRTSLAKKLSEADLDTTIRQFNRESARRPMKPGWGRAS